MRILLIAHYYPPHVGGLEKVVEQQAASLACAGNNVTVLTCAMPGMDPAESVEHGVRVVRMSSADLFDRRFGIPFPVPLAWRRIFKEVKEADLVHMHDVFYVSSWLGYIAARRYGRPIFLTQHVAVVSHPSKLVMGIQRAVYASWGRLLFNGSRAIIVYNRIVKDFLARKGYTSKVIEMRNGVDIDTFAPPSRSEKKALRSRFGISPDAFVVLAVGRLVPKKGFDLLLQAASEKYELVFAGPGEIPSGFEENAHVRFLGSLDQDALSQVYKASDLFVLPSKGELFTLAMQEAMASGLPVVTTMEPEYASYGLDNEMVALISRDSLSIRDTLETLMQDVERRERMSTYSTAYARQNFDKNANSESLQAVYADELRVVVTTSWDDGHQLDVRLSELLSKYGIRGTFYIAPQDREIPHTQRLREDQIRALSARFEIGAHTLTHPHLTKVSDTDARHEIELSRRNLEQAIGLPVRSFCYPAGYYDSRHPQMLQESGYALGRTVKRFSTTLRYSDPYLMPTTLHAYRHWSDALPILRAVGIRQFFRCYLHWDELAIRIFDTVERNGGLFHLWGHSWEVDNNGDWQRLERVLAHISKRAGVQYLTNGELV